SGGSCSMTPPPRRQRGRAISGPRRASPMSRPCSRRKRDEGLTLARYLAARQESEASVKVMVTGGAGFIGTSVVRHLLGGGVGVVNVDKLTYAGSNPPLGALAEGGRYALEVADIADPAALARIFAEHLPDAVMHLAAETHVDRSIDRADDFIHTNLVGTFTLL